MIKKDIQMFLDSHKKAVIIWDKLEYCIYPKHIIDACLRDYDK